MKTETNHRFIDITSFYFFQYIPMEKATVRMLSYPLFEQISKMENYKARLIRDENEIVAPLEKHACAVFNYDDNFAADVIRKLANPDILVICIGSDIYSTHYYSNLCDFVSFFLMPSRYHAEVLGYLVPKPVYAISEGIDYSIDRGPEYLDVFPDKNSKKMVWFGYSESFYKGVLPLLPVIRAAVATGMIDSFTVICDLKNFNNYFEFDIVDYKNESFFETLRTYDYALLSHIPSDLSLNSYIKTANKAVTALTQGVIPLMSDTPNYTDLADFFQIKHLIFASAFDLFLKLKQLNPIKDSAELRDAKILEKLKTTFSKELLSKQFFLRLEEFLKIDEFDEFQRCSAPYNFPTTELNDILLNNQERDIRFSAHLSDLLPSLRRALEERRKKLMNR